MKSENSTVISESGCFDWFPVGQVFGHMASEEKAERLRAIGDTETAKMWDAVAARGRRRGKRPVMEAGLGSTIKGLFRDHAYQHTSHAFGYLGSAVRRRNGLLPIQHAGSIAPDATLRNARIKITLDRLRVAEYPGRGTHHVLFDFYAQNQIPKAVEHLHFNCTCRVREGQQAAVIGCPVFVGLSVGTEGVSFKGRTVNVKNEEDERFLAFLDSDVFKTGLKLATVAQPAIGQFSNMAVGLTKAFLGCAKNVCVQDFTMGLDFSNVPTRARLAEGSYLAVQIPETNAVVWNWDEWGFDPSNGQIVSKEDTRKLIPFNYLVFSVSRYAED